MGAGDPIWRVLRVLNPGWAWSIAVPMAPVGLW